MLRVATGKKRAKSRFLYIIGNIYQLLTWFYIICAFSISFVCEKAEKYVFRSVISVIKQKRAIQQKNQLSKVINTIIT